MVSEHGLSDRKAKILHAIIQNYLETGESQLVSEPYHQSIRI